MSRSIASALAAAALAVHAGAITGHALGILVACSGTLPNFVLRRLLAMMLGQGVLTEFFAIEG